jgi:hypothetical protein
MVVPEPLILLTGALQDRDRRLRDQAVGWCAEHMAVVSTSALNHTYTRERWPIEAIADLAATVAQVAGARWPRRELGTPFATGGTFEPWGNPFGGRGGFPLRVRAAFGVGARAETVRALVLQYPAEPTVAELSDSTLATKRHTADAVQNLEWAGIVGIDRQKQPYRVRLRRREEVAQLFGPLPQVATSWGPLLRFIAGAVRALDDVATLPAAVAGAQLHRRLRHLDDQMTRLRLDPPEPTAGDDYLSATSGWLVRLIEEVATAREALPFVWRVQGQDLVN